VPSSRVVCTRVSTEVADKLEEIARKKRKKVSEILKEIVDSYLESTPETTDSDTGVTEIDNILNQFNDRAMEYIENFKKFCKEHSDTVAQKQPGVDKEFVYEHCLWSFRRHVYNTLKLYYEEKVIPLLRRYIRDSHTQLSVERRVMEIINKAVKELYPYPYPPVKPP
jgi:hypothetical protein